MSFRKRNTVISAAPSSQAAGTLSAKADSQPAAGVRPSPLDGRITTSTGTASLDSLLAGHAGLPLGSSLLFEEQGTTDFSGVLLRYYAAEGLVQGHQVHVLGFGDGWRYELPALGSSTAAKTASKHKSESALDGKMKIAWRYEALGNRGQPLPVRAPEKEDSSASTFCHSFDLSKRLAPSAMKGQFYALPTSCPINLSFDSTRTDTSPPSPLKLFIKHLLDKLASSPPTSIHRVVVPSLLSPALYAGGSCDPTEVLQFMHSLRAALRLHGRQLTAMLTLPVSLIPRTSGLTRWMELLCDGVIELVPLPANLGATPPSDRKDSKEAEKVQGMVKVYTMPVYHEKGGGGAEGNYFRDNLSFSLSSSRGLVVKPYSLPPMEVEDHKEKSRASTAKDGIDF